VEGENDGTQKSLDKLNLPSYPLLVVFGLTLKRTTQHVKDYDVICVEDLAVKNILQSP